MSKIIFIAGAGRSGSTMLDAILGSKDGYFSCGELVNFSINGLLRNEYCACGKEVPSCDVWSSVSKLWKERRQLSLERYNEMLSKYFLSYKNTFKCLNIIKNPSHDFELFINDTKTLYEIVFEITGAEVLIDSSKVPLRILLLKKIGYEIEVIHLVRRLEGVINSNKKSYKKNLKAGVEKDRKPTKSLVTARKWALINFMIIAFSQRLERRVINYESLINNLKETIAKITTLNSDFEEKLDKRGPFFPNHIVAGNKMRMHHSFNVLENPEGMDLPHLTTFDKYLAAILNKIFY